MTNTIVMLFLTATQTYQLPPGLLSSLCYVESKHKIDAVHHDDGNSDSLGICQIKYETAKHLGFKGTKADLMDPKNNITYAAKYLKSQLKRYNGNSPKAVAAYNMGHFSPGKVFAKNQSYVDAVFKAWAEAK